MWQRRAFLQAAGAGLLASLSPDRAMALATAETVYASAIQLRTGSYGAVLLNERGGVISTLQLPDRGHDVTWSPVTGQGVVFARQPGTFALVFDPKGQTAPLTLTAPEGRHFFGHGVFASDGKLLYATENDFDAARGLIGIYDVTNRYKRIGEFETHGIGPHEMLLMPDGETFVVANGGIETHPDFGRAELNIDSMDPSLAFIDRRSGALIGQLRLAVGLHQLSIRHLAVDTKARVWFGCQYRGPASDKPQLLGYATREGDIRLIELPEPELGRLRNYIGSLAISGDGEVVAVSSPEGSTILAINTATAEVVRTLTLDNGCGIAPAGAGFLASSGNGRLEGLGGAALDLTLDFGFDNHLRRLA